VDRHTTTSLASEVLEGMERKSWLRRAARRVVDRPGRRVSATAAESDDDAFERLLERLRKGGTIDADGVRLTSERLLRILQAAPQDPARPGRALLKEAKFKGATFESVADFRDATFEGEADFSEATFSGGAHFNGATFCNADFSLAAFIGGADFIRVAFSSSACFTLASFAGGAYFRGASFGGLASFIDASFGSVATFNGASFGGFAASSAVFSGGVDFGSATFERAAHFDKAKFESEDAAGLEDKVGFESATFKAEAHFPETTFRRTADLEKPGGGSRVTSSHPKTAGWLSAKNTVFSARAAERAPRGRAKLAASGSARHAVVPPFGLDRPTRSRRCSQA
jgi:uncharacterized protein YjbI with pentapeptide repeats